jgi:predicted dehydrogenase
VAEIALGIIGCGHIADVHLPKIVASKAFRLVGYADLDRELAERRRMQFGGEYATTDADRILGDSSVDAVCIFTPLTAHASLAIGSAAAGKPFFCEKPLAATAEECRSIQRAVSNSGVKNVVGYWFRHHEAFQELHTRMDEPRLILSRTAWSVADWGRWRQNPTPLEILQERDPRDHFGFFDHLGYVIDTANFLIPAPAISVNAASIGASGRGGSGAIIVKYANGSVLFSAYSELGGGGLLGKWFFEIISGDVNASLDNLTSLSIVENGTVARSEFSYTSGRDEQWVRFASYLNEGGPSPLDVWDGSIPTIVNQQALASARSGGGAAIDLEAEMIVRPA